MLEVQQKEIGDGCNLEGAIITPENKQDEGAMGSFDQGLEEIIGTFEIIEFCHEGVFQ